MTSPRRRLANRRNALRSSGPRTVAGKRRSAANSTQHGLTSSIESTPWMDVINPITELLISEGFTRAEAWLTARCILDYERNVRYQQERFLLSQSGQRPKVYVSDAAEDELTNVRIMDRALEDKAGNFFGFGEEAAKELSQFFKYLAEQKLREAKSQ